MQMSSSARRALRARAHVLKPVVMVGAAGVTSGVIAAVDRALCDHGLIKVRVSAGERGERRDMIKRICADSGAELIQTVGHVAVLFREPEDEELRQQFLQVLD